MKEETFDCIRILAEGGIGVLPTDTIYGLVGSALSEKAVMRIYRVRKRDLKKPMIVLIGSVNDLKRFNIRLENRHSEILKKVWPGPVSVLLPCASKKFSYLHRGTQMTAFRLPRPLWLRNLLKETGPLVAPSANIEGKASAKTIREAKNYFGTQADFYVQGTKIRKEPSVLIRILR